MHFHRLTIIRAITPNRKSVNEQLQWFGGSLGLFSARDKDKSCFRVFITLLKSAKEKRELSSDELAGLTGLTRGTIIHHLNRLISAGIVESYKSKYVLRVNNLESLVDKIENDMNETISELRKVGVEIDKKLSL